MFRHSALLFVALLCVADAQFNALTVNKTKTGNKLPKGAHKDQTKLRKVTGFDLCTKPYNAYIGGAGVAGTGAFSYPVYPGDCDTVDSNTEQIGSLSATCSGNPYEGETFTFILPATTEDFFNPLDVVGPCGSGGNCIYNATGAPQFFVDIFDTLDFVIPDNTTSEEVQNFVDTFCGELSGEAVEAFKLSQCSAELRLSGDNRKNKHPGSILSFDYMTNTTLIPAGSTYTTITQYGLGGAGQYRNFVNVGEFGYVSRVDLFAYAVIDSVTCVFRPDTIDTTFGKIYGGMGRFAKYPASKVASVNLETIANDGPPDASNPVNFFEVAPIEWETQLEVNYVKPYLHSSML